MTGPVSLRDASVVLVCLEHKDLNSSFAKTHGLSSRGMTRCQEQLQSISMLKDDKRSIALFSSIGSMAENGSLKQELIEDEEQCESSIKLAENDSLKPELIKDEEQCEPSIKLEPLPWDEPLLEDIESVDKEKHFISNHCIINQEFKSNEMNEVQVHIDDFRMDLAATLLLSHDVEYNTLNEMIQIENTPVVEDTKTFALILSVKAPKPTAKRLNYQRGGKEVETYHRLVLCRELQEGNVFYILSTDTSQSCHLFRGSNTQFVGGFVAIFEGAREGTIHDIPVVVTKTSLVPIVPTFETIMVDPILRDLCHNEKIRSFLIEVEAPVFVQCGRMPTCRSRFCDSRHPPEVACPGLVRGKLTGHAITFLFSSPQHKIINCEFTSEALTEVFVSPRVLGNPKSKMRGLRKAVKEVTAHYAARGIPFIVAGWQKRRRSLDEASSVRIIHVTFIAPKKLLADAPRFNTAEVVPPQPTTSALTTDGVVQQAYMLALQEEEEEELMEEKINGY